MITFFAVMPVNVNVYTPPRNVSLQMPLSPPRNSVLAISVLYLPLRPSAADGAAASATPTADIPTTATAATPSVLTRPAGLMANAAYRHAPCLVSGPFRVGLDPAVRITIRFRTSRRLSNAQSSAKGEAYRKVPVRPRGTELSTRAWKWLPQAGSGAAIPSFEAATKPKR